MTSPFSQPTAECDLVMKGGITSGIVYPPAVIKLAQTYRFRCVGGTSAGAIAAAITAAAEYGREQNGFEKLREINQQLGQENFLISLFQPSAETRPLMDTLLALTQEIKMKAPQPGANEQPLHLAVWNHLRTFERISRRLNTKAFNKGACYGLLTGVGLAFLFAAFSFVVFWLIASALSWGSFGVIFLLLTFILGWIGIEVGGLGSSVYHLFQILTVKVPENFFGLCTGKKSDAPNQPETFTDWLSTSINHLAGLDPRGRPLTFGELEKRGIMLKMVTSNLSQNQPFELPLENRDIIFAKADFDKLFPAEMVNYLIRRGHKSHRIALPEGYYFLPAADDLPVAVAMRMSLSFPLLISAIPLYTISRAAFNQAELNEKDQQIIRKNHLQQNWFSDGGIASNFPIHFFDNWLPTRPTFGIKLEELPPEALRGDEPDATIKKKYVNVAIQQNQQAEPAEEPVAEDEMFKAVFMPLANSPLVSDWKPLQQSGKLSLTKFLWAIFATAQNYRDNTQSALPGYRERIVQIRLSAEEGGLNLAMKPDTIERMMRKGQMAGTKILEHFVTQGRFEHHKWVRLRVLMNELEGQLTSLRKLLRGSDFLLTKLMDDQIAAKNGDDPNKKYPYPREATWCKTAADRVEMLIKVFDDWGDPIFNRHPPKPEPIMRVTPRL